MSLLQVDGVTVRFGGLQALISVDLSVEPGGITGLIGPNGAGKTTLFNVVCGLQAATSGRVSFDGREITDLRPHERARLGIARTFQRLEVFGSLSARENLLVAAEIRKRWSEDHERPADVVEEILDLVGLRRVADDRVDAMPTGLARMVELGRALAIRPRLLLLDEPSSGLGEAESEEFGKVLLGLASRGLGILIVEHDVELVMRISRLIYVLDFGRLIAVGTPDEIRASAAVQEAYLGAAAPSAG